MSKASVARSRAVAKVVSRNKWRWRLWRDHRGACFYCKRRTLLSDCHKAEPLFATVDHVIPVSRGGANVYENLVLACRVCNEQKGSMTDEEWAFHQRDKALAANGGQ